MNLLTTPEEGEILPMPWKAVYEDAKAWVRKWEKKHGEKVNSSVDGGDAYGCSFSSNGDDVEDKLTFWRFYGNDGDGCSFKISSSVFSEYKKIYRVRYRDSSGNASSCAERREDKEIEQQMRKLLDLTRAFVESATNFEQFACMQNGCRVPL